MSIANLRQDDDSTRQSTHRNKDIFPRCPHTDLDPTLIDVLRRAGPEADPQRLALLHGRRVLFVMGGYPGKRTMYERTHELGISMVVLDGPGH